MRLFRLVIAAALLPAAALIAYQIAIRFNGNTSVIDTVGNVVAIVVLIALLAGVSRIAADRDWLERVGTAFGLGFAYFSLTWAIYGDPGRSVDEAPHLVWLGTSIVAFSPAIVIIPAAKWIWENVNSPEPTPTL